MNWSTEAGNQSDEKQFEGGEKQVGVIEKHFGTKEEEVQPFEINWKDLWEKSKLEFWGLIAFFLLSFFATLVRIYRKRQNGGQGRRRGDDAAEDDDAGHRGPGVGLAALSRRASEADEGAEESI